MRCNCCDRVLGDTEVQIAPDNTYEPCATCMEIAMDAAYSDGWVRPGDEEFDLDEDSDFELADDEIENFDDETEYRSYYDHCDITPAVNSFDPDENYYE